MTDHIVKKGDSLRDVRAGDTVFVDPAYTNKDVPTQWFCTAVGASSTAYTLMISLPPGKGIDTLNKLKGFFLLFMVMIGMLLPW